MPTQQVVITIDANGAARVEVNGCSGPACKDLTRAVERALGTTTDDAHKPEYYNRHQHGQGQVH